MATAAKKQDMPPSGGYKPLHFSRVPARTYFGGKGLIFSHLAVTVGALCLYNINRKKVDIEDLENRSSMMAILPLLQAERDREYLKQLRRNREEEEKLMANVDGWVVGQYNGEPVFKTYPQDTLIKPSLREYFVHGPVKAYKDFAEIMRWN